MRRLGLLAAVIATCPASAPAGPVPDGVAHVLHDRRLTRYTVAMADLNGDRRPEALVYAMADADGGGAANLCGSGGCDLIVLTPASGGYRRIVTITLVRPPVRILPTITRGWHDIGVVVAGGGIVSGHIARLRFDGRSYPSNPTLPPATRLRAAAGRAVIRDVPPADRRGRE
jgi:hypothetical protein